MADGSGITAGARVVDCGGSDGLTLRDARQTGCIVARCRCGQEEAPDVTAWLGSAFTLGCPLSVLARRLRCVCGSRDVLLDVRPFRPAEPARRTIYVWRA